MDRYSLIALFSAAALAAGGASAAPNLAPKDAERRYGRGERETLSELPFANRQDFEDARRGFVATIPDAEVKAADGRVIWSMEPFKFLAATARRQRSTRACGARRRSTRSTVCSRSPTACTRCAGWTSRT